MDRSILSEATCAPNHSVACLLFVGNRESKASVRNGNASHPVNEICELRVRGQTTLGSQVRTAGAMLGLDASVSYRSAEQHDQESLIFDAYGTVATETEANFE